MAAVMAHNVNKRKRDSQDLPNLRAAPGLTSEGADFTQQYIHADDDGMDNTGGGVDFAAVLSQHNTAGGSSSNEHAQGDVQSHLQHSRAQAQTQAAAQRTGQSASDTATAALAQYHTMTVPQPTEQSFMNQATDNGDRPSGTPVDHTPTHQHRPSFGGDMDFASLKDNGPPTNGDSSPSNGGPSHTPGSKPAVGSDEWHKVRRDNHKEGAYLERERLLIPAHQLTLF